MTPALLLALAAAAAQQDGYVEFSATPDVELGTVEFPAGPAMGIARFYLSGTEPRVDVRIRNVGPGPIWWRGAGLGCVGSDWLVLPASLDGTRPPLGFQGIGCSMERNKPPTPQDLARWSIAPGQSSEVWNARPFAEWEDPPVSVPPLDRWAWCHEFTLPRDTAPPQSMDFECPALVLAWSRATGPRVFVSRNQDVHFDHFNPFADEPFQRGPGPHPVRFGPLRGTVELRHENGWPIADFTLTNPTEREIAWSARGAGGAREWGFTTLDFSSAAFEEDRLLEDTLIRRALGAMPVAEECRFAPGQTRTISIAPFSESLGSRVAWERPSGPQGLQRWEFILSSTWPAAAAGGDPIYLPTRLFLHYDADYGFDAGLQVPDDYADGYSWKPYRNNATDSEVTESIRFGPVAFIVSGFLRSGNCMLRLFNDGGTPAYWTGRAPELMHWIQLPGAEPGRLTLPSAPFPWPDGDEVPDDVARERSWIGAGGQTQDLLSFEHLYRKDSAFPRLTAGPWDVILPIVVPQRNPPAHEGDFQHGWMRLRWHPDRGLEASVGEVWPF